MVGWILYLCVGAGGHIISLYFFGSRSTETAAHVYSRIDQQPAAANQQQGRDVEEESKGHTQHERVRLLFAMSWQHHLFRCHTNIKKSLQTPICAAFLSLLAVLEHLTFIFYIIYKYNTILRSLMWVSLYRLNGLYSIDIQTLSRVIWLLAGSIQR